LFLGGVLKLAPTDFVRVLYACFLAAGASLELSIYLLCVELGASRRAAMFAALLFAASPAFLLYEHELFYTLPEAALLALSAVMLVPLLRRPTFWRACCFFTTLLCLCGIRSTYHPFILPVVLIWLFIERPNHRRAIGLGAALPVLAGIAWCVRGAILFGTASTSSWLGMNLANNVRMVASPVLRESLMQRGVITDLLEKPPFQDLQAYSLTAEVPDRFSDVPALSDPHKSEGLTGGEQCDVNFNHYAYLDLSRRYLGEVVSLYLHSPTVFFARLILAANYYLYPASRYERLQSNSRPIEGYVEWWDRWIFGKRTLSWVSIDDKPAAWYPLLAAMIIVLPFFGAAFARTGALDTAQRAVLYYMAACFAYVTLLSLLIEVPENNRFRFSIDPFLAVLLTLLVVRAWARIPGTLRRLRAR
jgi:hypothetical protein